MTDEAKFRDSVSFGKGLVCLKHVLLTSSLLGFNKMPFEELLHAIRRHSRNNLTPDDLNNKLGLATLLIGARSS